MYGYVQLVTKFSIKNLYTYAYQKQISSIYTANRAFKVTVETSLGYKYGQGFEMSA